MELTDILYVVSLLMLIGVLTLFFIVLIQDIKRKKIMPELKTRGEIIGILFDTTSLDVYAIEEVIDVLVNEKIIELKNEN